MTTPILELRQVSVKYDAQNEPTLRELNLSVQKGEKILLAGSSGSGKTTLVRLLNGLIPHEFKADVTGEIFINGQNVTKQNVFERSLELGTVLQDSNAQFVGLTTAEDLAFALENDNVVHYKMLEQVQKWAKDLNLLHLLNLSPQVLSGGEKQRVAMAGVLIDDAPILLFDEPLASLDPASGQRMMQLIDRLQAEQNLTVIIVEHRVEEVLRGKVDRVLILDEGKIVIDETPIEALKLNDFAKYGLSTPGYIRLLSQAGIDLKNVEELDQPQKLAGEQVADKLQQYALAQTDSGHAKTENAQLLKIQNLDFAYGKHEIFHQLNLTLNQGEITALVGKNGSGKSTLSQLIVGFLAPTSGSIVFNKTDLLALSIKERSAYVGYVAQNPNQMITQVSVFDEVAVGLRLRGEDDEKIHEKVNELLKIADLYSMRNWPVSVLSYGQKKRLTIMAVLALQPELLILDEPTAGQDLTHANEIMEFVQKLNHDLQISIVLVTHDMTLLQAVAQRAIVLVAGEIIADTTPAELLTNHELVERADLQVTSIATLAERFGIKNVTDLVRSATLRTEGNDGK
ncbi:MAG: energy-coupling factor ABC transporter ATP-binding protein [Lactobacillaceae bacterium]|jgi:energy-coupling factor transport system ATP-binding protein|nr:energy-coupling factor ABC transporter ATP-binding protein [Lactobacillaceae bacterium]